MPNVNAASIEDCVSCGFTPARKAGLPPAQKPASIDGAKRMLQIDAGRKTRRFISGKAPLQRPLQAPLVGQPRGPFRSRSPPVALPADLQLAGMGLPQPLHRQSQHLVLDLHIKHPPHQIPFLRPEMDQTFVMLSRNGILRLRQVKQDCAVVQHHGISRTCKKIFHRPHQCFRRHR